MIRSSCPHCFRKLAFPDDRAGLPKTCPFCAHQFNDSPLITANPEEGALGPALPATGGFSQSPLLSAERGRIEVPVPRPYGGPAAMTSIGRRSRGSWFVDNAGWLLIAAVVAFGLALAAVYFITKIDVWIYVDNGGSQPLQVSLDGSQAATVAPGQVEIVKCRAGKTRIQVKRGDQVVFDEVKNLQKPDNRDVGKYILNPELIRRYWMYDVEYGIPFSSLNFDQFSQLVMDGDRDQWVKSRYQELARRPHLIEPGPWVEADPEQCDHVLEKAPTSAGGGLFAKRRVLARMDRQDYDFILEARKKTNPTMADLQALSETVDRLSAEAK
jgi:hypothetical protein